MAARIYRVLNTLTGNDHLVRAHSQAQARAEAARRKAAVECARKLSAAVDALHAFSMACLEVGDGSEVRRADDGRVLLAENMREYATWLEEVYGERT